MLGVRGWHSHDAWRLRNYLVGPQDRHRALTKLFDLMIFYTHTSVVDSSSRLSDGSSCRYHISHSRQLFRYKIHLSYTHGPSSRVDGSFHAITSRGLFLNMIEEDSYTPL